MKYLTVRDVLELYSRIFVNLGGKVGIRDVALLESAVNRRRLPLEVMTSMKV